MKVALYHPWLKEKGGAEKVVLELARGSSHEVTIFTKYYNQEKTFPGFEETDIQVIGKNKEPKGFIDRLLRFELGALFTKMPLDDFDTLLVSTSGVGTSITLRNHQTPTISYTHTPLRTALPEFRASYRKEMPLPLKPVYEVAVEFFSRLENISYKFFDHVIANSQNTKRRVLERKLAKEENISIVNPGADVENNQSSSYKNYFLYPTRFRRYKRQDLVIEAFEEADLSDFKLILAGSNQEEEYVEELRQKAGNRIEIETDVTGKRWQELYENAYTVLFAAEDEDWGIVPIEAGSYSKPVISVNEGGPTESIKDGETGFLVEPTPEAFARKMRYLSKNPEKVKEMGREAWEESKKYSWENFCKKADSILQTQYRE